MKDFFWLSSVLFQVLDGFLICLKDTGLGAGLNCHVAKCHTVADAQSLCTLTGKLHHLVVASVCADLADDGEDQVSRINALRQFSYKIEFYAFRYEYPGSSRYHAVQEIGTADTGAECAECSVRAGMAVSAEDQLARADIVLDHHLMAYTFSFPEVNVVLSCKITHLFLGCCCFRAVGRHVVVNDKNQLFRIRDVRMV